jgi:hypothetical protein
MARTPSAGAEAIAELAARRNILNFCGRLIDFTALTDKVKSLPPIKGRA